MRGARTESARIPHAERTPSALSHRQCGRTVLHVTLALPPMDELQRAVLAELVQTVATGEYDAVRPALDAAERNRVWLPPPLIAVAAGLVCVVTSELDVRPWQVSDDLWEEHLPELRPSGRSEWRRAILTLNAAAALAGGVWLDVAAAESYSRSPLWPVALDVVQLLARIAVTSTALTPTLLADRLTDLLHLTAPTTPAA